MKNPFHVMLIPTLGCPSRCSYCWSSEEGSPIMSIDIVHEVVAWLKNIHSDLITITFHGGEPLLAGVEFYREALPLITDGLHDRPPEFAMQTNLWRMTPEIAKILAAYHVPIGSSIDGPEDITDSQRGKGYFEKTMRGYGIAKAHGLNVRFICTFTNQSAKHRKDIVDFFLENKFTMKLHPALPSLRSEDPGRWALPPVDYGDLLVYLLDQSLEHIHDIDIMNINDLCRCVFTRRGTVCTFVDCMGTTFAVGPEGNIYPCYRFVGMAEYVMGNVKDHPSLDDLMSSGAGILMKRFREYVDSACGSCTHIRYCRGGCPYNAMAMTPGEIRGVDPHCTAYKRIFDEISERFNQEMSDTAVFEKSPFLPGSMDARPGILALMRKAVSR